MKTGRACFIAKCAGRATLFPLVMLACSCRSEPASPSGSDAVSSAPPVPGKLETEQDDSASSPIPEMVCIPAGTSLMGGMGFGASPVHSVSVDEFWIGKYEVTNREFAVFVEQTGYVTWAEEHPQFAFHSPDTHTTASDWKGVAGYEDGVLANPSHPVVFVAHYDAVAYCKWLSEATGHPFRLPREDEWERAARGGLKLKPYVLGDEPGPIREAEEGLATVGTMSPPNPYGLYDMGGNVLEMTSSLYWPYPYDPNDGREEPDSIKLNNRLKGKSHRAVRGRYYVRRGAATSMRWDVLPCYARDVIGFRVASSQCPEGNERDTVESPETE